MKIRIGGRVREVETRVEDEAVLITLDGVSHRVPYQRDPDGSLRLSIDGRTVPAWSDSTWAVADGRARPIERIAAAAKEELPDRITPPMPAMVVRVEVSVGAVVARGDRVVVISAMKTETALKAPRDGVIKAVNVVAGQSVRPGELLVELE